MGDVVAILLVQWLLNLGVQWNYAFMIFMLLFLGIAFLHHFFIDEVEVEEENREETICEYVTNTYRIIK